MNELKNELSNKSLTKSRSKRSAIALTLGQIRSRVVECQEQ
jgi:hypothetical protein